MKHDGMAPLKMEFRLSTSKRDKMSNTNNKKRKLTESPDHGYVTEDSTSNSPEFLSGKRSSASNKNCT
jgi:hypothetical protein